jgi:hypothetical protein
VHAYGRALQQQSMRRAFLTLCDAQGGKDSMPTQPGMAIINTAVWPVPVQCVVQGVALSLRLQHGW